MIIRLFLIKFQYMWRWLILLMIIWNFWADIVWNICFLRGSFNALVMRF